MIDQEQFLEHIIVPALKDIELDSPAARKLLLGTAIQESKLKYLKQLGDGPALGFFQMEPFTHDDIWNNVLAYNPTLHDRVHDICVRSDSICLISCPLYAAAMCRVQYWRWPDPIPEIQDTLGMAMFWKKRYNTERGKGTFNEYMYNWGMYGLPDEAFFNGF